MGYSCSINIAAIFQKFSEIKILQKSLELRTKATK